MGFGRAAGTPCSAIDARPAVRAIRAGLIDRLTGLTGPTGPISASPT
ncbi:hypothetical protein [Streptomyces sp. bgisy022]